MYGVGRRTYVGCRPDEKTLEVVIVRFRSILYTEDRGEVEDRRDTTGMNVVWGIR